MVKLESEKRIVPCGVVPKVRWARGAQCKPGRQRMPWLSSARAASLVDSLSTRDGRLLPPGVALNVNYPARFRDTVRGVRLTHQGASILYKLEYEPVGEGRFEVSFARAEKIDADPAADTRAIAEGYVSVTPLYASWTSEDQVMADLTPLAEGLAPLPAATAP